MHGVVGSIEPAGFDGAGQSIRASAVPLGVIHAMMIDRAHPDVLQRAIGQEPIGRPGRPEYIGKAAPWLGGDLSGFVTGATIAIDGG